MVLTVYFHLALIKMKNKIHLILLAFHIINLIRIFNKKELMKLNVSKFEAVILHSCVICNRVKINNNLSINELTKSKGHFSLSGL